MHPYGAVGVFSAVLGGMDGQEGHAGPSRPIGQEERLKRTPAPLGPAQPTLQVGFKIRSSSLEKCTHVLWLVVGQTNDSKVIKAGWTSY